MKKIWIAVGAAAAVLALSLWVLRFKDAFRPAKPQIPKEEAPQRNFDALLKEAIALEDQLELVKARTVLRSLMAFFIAHPRIEEAQKRLENVNMRIILSAISIPGETTVREVREGDTLSMIADEFRTTVGFIKRQNGLSSDVIRPGMRLRIWTNRFGVLVDKSQNLLFLKSNGEVLKTYQVSTGKENITPVGTFKIVNKLVEPSWTHGGKVIPPGSPENILGTRWLGFNVPGYGIHGTTQPGTIGQQVTAGCVRMLNADVEELYDLLPVNTEVIIMD